MSLTKLDADQVIQSSFDEGNEALKVNVVANDAGGASSTAINDGTITSQKAAINASGELSVTAATLPLPADAATETTLATLNAKSGSAMVNSAFDYQLISYVTVGNGIGEIESVVYKSGGAAGTVVATVSMTYDASNKLSTVTKT